MKLATIRTLSGTTAVRLLDDETRVAELAYRDVGELLTDEDWRANAAGQHGAEHLVADLDFAPVVPNPAKVICIGRNYHDHIAELSTVHGGDVPQFPTLFPKFSRTLIGANDPIVLPPESHQVDWEAELCVVIGTTIRHADERQAIDAVAGFTVLNDISMRDYQRNTSQFMAGKIWEDSTPVGPWLTVIDHPADRASVTPELDISCTVDGEQMQGSNTSLLIFDVIELVRYISTIITLDPGDLISTGTPGGVGAGRDPQMFLQPGQLVVTRIEDLGECRNETVRG